MGGSNPIVTSFEVLCRGGWVAIQQRTSNAMDFERKWAEYASGFGDGDNFWLGNDNIHTITASGSELRFDLTDDQGATAFAKYASFAIGDGSTSYKLAVSTYSGTAGDSFSAHNGYKFSTKDQDNDVASGSCALNYHGAWWYNTCHSSNLNGLYHTPGPHASYADGVNWYAWKGMYNSLARTMMLVRPLECVQVPSGSYMYKGNELSGKTLCCPAGWYVSLPRLRLACCQRFLFISDYSPHLPHTFLPQD